MGGVQLHWVGGQGIEVVRECEFQRYHRDFLDNGYFRFKGVQEIVMDRYVKKGLHGCNYEVPYFVGPYSKKNPKFPVHPGYAHSLAKFIKMNQLCGFYDYERYLDLAVLCTDHLAQIMLKNIEFTRQGQKCTHMNMWNWVGTVKDI